VLAPLTALLVLQVSIYQTVYSALRRVASVVAGVLLALALSAWVGFTWWSLGITIALGLAVGFALRLREHMLEVPISAMLILSVGTRSAAASRVVETFIGTAAGLAAALVLTSPQVQPAEEAIADLTRRMAGLLDQMAAGLRDGSASDSVRGWLDQARALGGEIRKVDEALQRAEESMRLNPRSPRLLYAAIALRQSLETLEHAATTVRVLARSLADSTGLDGDDSPVHDPQARGVLADVLGELSAAVRAYGGIATQPGAPDRDGTKAELERRLVAARDQQEQLSRRLAAVGPDRAGWPLRGELISHLDRLRTELEAGEPDSGARPRRGRRWPPPRVPRLAPRLRRLPPRVRRLAPGVRRLMARDAARASRPGTRI
jgi:uncharacterized membrane protein YccC